MQLLFNTVVFQLFVCASGQLGMISGVVVVDIDIHSDRDWVLVLLGVLG